jgi:hypothetical protein
MRAAESRLRIERTGANGFDRALALVCLSAGAADR